MLGSQGLDSARVLELLPIAVEDLISSRLSIEIHAIAFGENALSLR